MEETLSVLVVDDEAILRDLLDKILNREGYNVFLAQSAVEALQILDDNDIDIVLSDVKMPEVDGFELLKKIKNSHPDVGTIMMTRYEDAFSVKDALMLGADDYITKPFKSIEVSMIIERAHWRNLANKKRKESLLSLR